MNAPAVAKHDPKRRDCTCPEEDAPVCELECPTRPQFYCGQLLSDAQLNALVRWTQDRLGLVRYRAGWGVVCGLTVRCDPRCHTRVIVEPGYAISCCGDDLVLCDPACLDLAKACREPCDPCAEPEPDDDDEVCEIAGEKVRRRHLRTVDITISRGETPVASEPVSCGCSSGCKPGQDEEGECCAHTAIKEVASAGWRAAAPGDDPEAAALENWQKTYSACTLVVTRFQATFGNLAQLVHDEGEEPLSRRIREWLLAWLTRSPLHEFCFVHERIHHASKEQLCDPGWLATILFLIVQDCRNHHLLCDCHACAEDDVVRLARVWLLIDTDDYGRRACRILFIDPRPPYRRPLGRDCPPIPRKLVNAAARALWRDPDEACIELTDAGITIREVQSVRLPENLAGLLAFLEGDSHLSCSKTVVLKVLDHCPFGRRVIGWRSDGAEQLTERVAPRRGRGAGASGRARGGAGGARS